MAAPPTRPTLIQRMRDPDDAEAWGDFVAVYTPVIFNFCCSKGAPRSDAEDITQDIMRNVAGSIDGFEHRQQEAKFRSWLYAVARNTVNNYFRRKNRRPQGDGRTTVMAAGEIKVSEDEKKDLERWELDYRRQVFEWAAAQVEPDVSPNVWEAFWRTAVDGEKAATVADDLGMSRASVYVAKCRVLKRLQEKVHAVGERWESVGGGDSQKGG